MANQPKKYKKFLVGAASAALVASAVAPVSAAETKTFSDVLDTNSHKDAIYALVEKGIISGYADGTFGPNNDLTRSDVVKMMGKWLISLGYEAPADYKTKQRFDDISLTTADELLKLSALVHDQGVFNGSHGNLLPSDNITRENMALVLVRAYDAIHSTNLVEYVESKDFDKKVTDKAQAKAEARDYIDVLDFFQITNVTEFNPKNSTTRAQFASFLNRTLGVVVDAPGSENPAIASITAINNTTVEVTFKASIEDIKALDFAIEGLDVKNAAVKQSDDKTVVLTTDTQIGDKVYTVNLNGEKAGSFKGVSAVIPTAVKVVEQSLQAPVGTQVTLKAQVTVPEGQSKAGIPVTFNIVNTYGDNSTGTLNKPIVVETKTDGNGEATYTYTRYAQTSYQLTSSDEVQAYATGNPTARSFGKVYWANIQPLTLTEVTQGNAIQNGGKKVYKVKVATEHAETVSATEYTANVAYYNAKGIYGAGKYVNVGFGENTNVTPDKAVKTVDVIDASGRNLGYPGQYTTSVAGGNNLNNWVKEVKIQLDANGEAVFTLSGLDGAVSPYVFVDQKVNPANDNGTSGRNEATELFAKAPTVTFAKEHTLATKIEAVGTQYAASFFNGSLDAAGKHLNDHDGDYIANKLSALLNGNNVANLAAYSKADLESLLSDVGGRDYNITVTDKNGKLAPKGTKVGLQLAYGSSQRVNGGAIYLVDNTNKNLQYVTADAAVGTTKTIWTETGANGEISFTLAGYKDTYATPTVVIDSGDQKDVVDKNDQKIPGEIVYFSDAKVTTAVLKASKTTAQANGTEEIEFVYQTVDQNGKLYRPALNNLTANNPDLNNVPVTFELTTTFNPIEVKVGTSEETLPNFVNLSANTVEVGPDSNGNYLNNPLNYRSLTVVANDKGTASVKVTAKNGTDLNVVASTSIASLPQLLSSSVSFVNTVQVPSNYSGLVNKYNLVDKTLTFDGKTPVSYAGATYYFGGTVLDETGFITALKNASGSVLVNRTVDATGTKFTILNVATNGSAPVEEVPVVTPKPEEVTKTALTAALTAANTAKTDAVAGTEAGQYPVGAIETYTTAIEVAQAVANNAKATQADVDAAVATLATATTAFEKAVVPAAASELEVTASVANDIGFGVVTFQVAGTVGTELRDDVAEVILTFSGADKKPQTVTDYDATTGKFTYKGTLVTSDTVTVELKDQDGKVLETKVVTITK